MKFAHNKLIIFFLCIGLFLKDSSCIAQQATPNETTDNTPVFVVGGILGVVFLIGYIKSHSSHDLRKFKHKINDIDNLLANKNTIVKYRTNIHAEIFHAEQFYSDALQDKKSNKNRLAEEKQYFEQQKRIFNEYLKAYYVAQYNTFKNQFFENIIKYNTDAAREILYKNIVTLINEWKNLDGSIDTVYFTETTAMDKILTTTNAIKKTRTDTFNKLNAYSEY